MIPLLLKGLKPAALTPVNGKYRRESVAWQPDRARLFQFGTR
jgi:hypothetical protein